MNKRKALLLAIAYRRILQQRDRKQRLMWVRPVFARRPQLGAFSRLFQELKAEDPQLFFNFTRMSREKFEYLHVLVHSRLEKCYLFREPISAEERLALTLRFLASGDSMASLSFLFRISRSAVSGIIKECCTALWEVLSSIVFPKLNIETWKRIGAEFESTCHFPNCLGAIDGKHIVMQAPPASGSLYFNYKKEHSLVLLGICDANYIFTAVNIGAFGRQSDSSVFHHWEIGSQILNGTLPIPAAKSPDTGGPSLPYTFVADEAFPLKTNIMRPYPGRSTGRLSTDRRIFNYRLSSARMKIENTFGILSARWRILRRPIIANVTTVDEIIKACVCLHNFLQKESRNEYCPTGYVDREVNGVTIPGAWRDDEHASLPGLRVSTSHNSTRQAYYHREIYTKYFMEEGAVSWQMNSIARTS